MLSIKKISEDEMVKEWLSSYTSKNTLHGYLTAMKKYITMTKKTPSELINEAINESGEVVPKRKYLKYLDNFYLYLKNDEKLAEKSVNVNVKSVISFYKFHRIEIINPKMVKAAKTVNNDVPTIDEIRDALKVSNPMVRAYILIATSSGLSVSDIIRLKVKDVKNVDENEITTLKLARKKTGVPFYTFFSPEATRAIQQYISIRNGQGTLKGKAGERWRIKHRINSEDDYLFIKENINDDYLELIKKDYQAAEEFRRMTEYTFQDNFRLISKKINMEAESKGEYNRIRTHNFRKFFITTLTDLGFGIGDVHFLAGKELPAGFAPYHKPDGFRDDAINQWKDRYIDCLNHLMFEEKINDVTKDKYKKLEAEFKNYKRKSEIKMIEIEMNTKIQPNQVEIKDLQYRIQEIEEIIKLGEPDKRIGHHGERIPLRKFEIQEYRERIQHLEGEIRRIEFEIDQTKEYYLNQIDELKNS
ncbi:tyrosine-type recombinase/integrase [Methanosarcina mazei]|uniref:tyrosine-type recombinase/integrase n=1 Tax=Methanosarcina mazei TaxID=2209 RepID=UPI003C775BF9